MLKEGGNILAAEVWNFGVHAAVWQHSFRTGFYRAGQYRRRGYRQYRPRLGKYAQYCVYAYSHNQTNRALFFCVVGPGEDISADRYPWGMEEPDIRRLLMETGSARRRALSPSSSFNGTARPGCSSPAPYPLWRKLRSVWKKAVRSSQVNVANAFLKGDAPFTVPPHTKAYVLFDGGELTTRLSGTGNRGRKGFPNPA